MSLPQGEWETVNVVLQVVVYPMLLAAIQIGRRTLSELRQLNNRTTKLEVQQEDDRMRCEQIERHVTQLDDRVRRAEVALGPGARR